MSEILISRIRERVNSRTKAVPYPPVSRDKIEQAESQLGFSMPPLLNLCYQRIGNGGFGPNNGVIGLERGAPSDFGTIFETYTQLKSDQEMAGRSWALALLPFCGWGCNIFSCVDCGSAGYPVYTFEEFEAHAEEYTLERFFEMWLDGVDILSQCRGANLVEEKVINPFSGKEFIVFKRVRN